MGAFTAAMIGLSAASTAMNYSAQRRQARAVEGAGKYNAQVAEMQAKDALTRGREAENTLARDTRGLLGTQRTILAASGVDVASGTARQIQDETETLGEYDRLIITNNAQREAWGYRTQGAMNLAAAKNEAQAYRSASRSTLLTGAAQMASIYDSRRRR
jgi:hypothetical protein